MQNSNAGGSPFDFLARFAGPIAWLIAGLLLLFGGLPFGGRAARLGSALIVSVIRQVLRGLEALEATPSSLESPKPASSRTCQRSGFLSFEQLGTLKDGDTKVKFADVAGQQLYISTCRAGSIEDLLLEAVMVPSRSW